MSDEFRTRLEYERESYAHLGDKGLSEIEQSWELQKAPSGDYRVRYVRNIRDPEDDRYLDIQRTENYPLEADEVAEIEERLVEWVKSNEKRIETDLTEGDLTQLYSSLTGNETSAESISDHQEDLFTVNRARFTSTSSDSRGCFTPRERLWIDETTVEEYAGESALYETAEYRNRSADVEWSESSGDFEIEWESGKSPSAIDKILGTPELPVETWNRNLRKLEEQSPDYVRGLSPRAQNLLSMTDVFGNGKLQNGGVEKAAEELGIEIDDRGHITDYEAAREALKTGTEEDREYEEPDEDIDAVPNENEDTTLFGSIERHLEGDLRRIGPAIMSEEEYEQVMEGEA